MKISLGAAQFGFDYGVSNTNGKVSIEEVGKIIEAARKKSLRVIDTAIAYGDSEKVLGEVGVKDFEVITKLPEIPNNVDINDWINNEIDRSIGLLNIDKLHGVLLHKSDQLEGERGQIIWESLNRLKKDGYAKKIGVSIYEPGFLEQNYHKYDFDIIQTSANIIDRRIILSGWLKKLEDDDVEVHLRSPFLQGVLLQNSSQRPEYFSRWESLFSDWDLWQKRYATRVEACLAHLAAVSGNASITVGVSAYTEFYEIIAAFENIDPSEAPLDLISHEQDLINPALWRI